MNRNIYFYKLENKELRRKLSMIANARRHKIFIILNLRDKILEEEADGKANNKTLAKLIEERI